MICAYFVAIYTEYQRNGSSIGIYLVYSVDFGIKSFGECDFETNNICFAQILWD